MNTQWMVFLQAAKAHIQEGEVADFGDTQAEVEAAIEGSIVSDLSHFGLIEVSGTDAAQFLQNQLTNDVRLVSPAHSQLTAYCNPKGRVLAAFRLFMRADRYLLSLPQALAQPTLERLRKYVLMSKVTLAEAGDTLARIGLSATGAPQWLHESLGVVPEAVGDAVEVRDMTIIRLPGRHPRFEIHGAVDAVRSLWEYLTTRGARPVGADAWGLLDIRAGIPQLLAVNAEAFVPQMLNLHLLDGVSFKKGCYPGQEVVARMQYLGKLKRRMYLAHVDGARRPLPGEELFAPGSESGQGAGRIVDARPAPDGGYDLLAVVEIAAREAGEVRLEDATGAPLRFLDLPYAFE